MTFQLEDSSFLSLLVVSARWRMVALRRGGFPPMGGDAYPSYMTAAVKKDHEDMMAEEQTQQIEHPGCRHKLLPHPHLLKGRFMHSGHPSGGQSGHYVWKRRYHSHRVKRFYYFFFFFPMRCDREGDVLPAGRLVQEK